MTTPAPTFEYSPAPESATLAELRSEYGLFINGAWVSARDGATLPTSNPATGAQLAQVASAGAADVKRAVSAARAASANWAATPGIERGKILFRVARTLAERARRFAVVETLDGGKPIRESRDVDTVAAAQHFFYYAGWADKINLISPGAAPVGVVGQIIPWNFPLLMAAWKIAPALAAGNTVVLKPAETTPLSALLLAEVFNEAGLPPGVLNVITGAGATGAALVSSKLDKLAFTGSTAVGRNIAREVAGTNTRLTLELGGKGANIVFDDAAQDEAIEGIIRGIFFNQGHVCCAGSRLLVQESIQDEFLERLRARMSQIRVGDPMDKNTDLGAINSPQQLERIQELVAAGVAEGGELWSPACELPSAGSWFAPSLLSGLNQSARAVREEIFGPVLTVSSFRTPAEAIEKANNTQYGLAAGVWSEKGSKALGVAQALRAGVVWINTYNVFDAASPFGGYKESGYGREGGIPGLEAYLEH